MVKMDEQFLRYSALDSACMVEIHNNFWDSLDEEGYERTYKMTLDLFPVLTFMQTRGMRVNHALLDETKQDVLRSAAEKQSELDELVGHPLNVNSPKACAQYFYVELGLPPILKPKTKSITTDDMAMQRLVRGKAGQPGLRQAKLVQEIRGLQKLYGTYLDIRFDEDDRLRGAYNPRGTKFGRLSSSQTVFGTGMNYQNLPQEFKKFLVADDGYVLVEVDKRQAEWVIVAYFANDANMMNAIKSGLDVHVHTASLMFNLPAEVIAYENEVIGHETNAEKIKQMRLDDPILCKIYTPNWPRGMSLRQCGKKSNHGLNYDEGFMNFALLNEMEPGEAKKVVNLYHEIYPGIRKSYEVIKRQLEKDRTLTNCFGRKVRFMGDWGNDLWKSSYSMIPQSTVVDSLNQGMIRIYHDKSITVERNVDILAQVHDSILMQVPIEVAQNQPLFESFIEKVYDYTSPTLSYNGNDFKIATDAKIGFNWGGKHKVHNKEGMRDYKTYADMKDLLTMQGA
jgi:DNA polymerase I-like protein with 3'-5' exonuclease and polymerase domains